MTFTRVHHVSLVAGDLEEARHVLCDGFGLSVDEHRTPWPQGRTDDSESVTTVEFPIGEMFYAVSKPNDDDSDMGRFLASTNGRGGMYYIAISSDNIAADMQRLADHGVTPKGDWDGISPVFLDSDATQGLLIQIRSDDHYYAHPHYRGNGVVTGMAHIGIASRSAEEVRHFWGEVFGLTEDKSSERGLAPRPDRAGRAASDPVHLVEFPLGGTVIEISIPTTDDSGTARMVAEKAPLGSVYHHTCPFTPDVHRFMEQATAAGLQQIGAIPPREESTLVVGWLHPKSCLGMLIEVWNRPPGDDHYHIHPEI
ncbi:MAG: VOC family protein [Chloroflexi bacterium]|nr:VOC family protein [Chloroflexota bacterium]